MPAHVVKHSEPRLKCKCGKFQGAGCMAECVAFSWSKATRSYNSQRTAAANTAGVQARQLDYRGMHLADHSDTKDEAFFKILNASPGVSSFTV